MKQAELKDWYQSMTLGSLAEINKFYNSDVFFQDPFNSINGVDKVKAIFEEMFVKLEKPHFIFLDEIHNNGQSFITWDFNFKLKGTDYKIHGSSHLKWLDDKIVYHRDYWDVGEELLLKIPIVGFFYKFLHKKLSHKD